MKLALVGYGRMGRAIEEQAIAAGMDVILRIDSHNQDKLSPAHLAHVDVAIEFTRPEVAYSNVLACLQVGLPVVSGTTGWNDQLPAARQAASDHRTSFIHASNFSIGVNIFFELNKFLAIIMNTQPAYEVSLKEIHHTQKRDKPSGTAVTLAEHLLERIARKETWSLSGKGDAYAINIESMRDEGIPGTHHVLYHSEIDSIEITHTAHNRKGFALGALAAARYIVGKSGVFTMKDVLGL